jgi:8-oxo-dGTP pyrophosphatase MutT (NUDIX family)
MDPGEDARAAARREALEELGINPSSFEIIGELSPLYIPPSGFCVYPIVAYAPQPPPFAPSEEEVAEVIEVPVAHLLAPATRCEEIWDLRGSPILVPYYAVGPHKVWGATAMMLCELLSLL